MTCRAWYGWSYWSWSDQCEPLKVVHWTTTEYERRQNAYLHFIFWVAYTEQGTLISYGWSKGGMYFLLESWSSLDECSRPRQQKSRSQASYTQKKSTRRNEGPNVYHEEWDLRDFKDKNVFSFAPPRPENSMDPWSTLLEPLLKKDGERCAIWKDEVQNLLIFVSRIFSF